jgi:hypothetical protein
VFEWEWVHHQGENMGSINTPAVREDLSADCFWKGLLSLGREPVDYSLLCRLGLRKHLSEVPVHVHWIR